MASECKIKLDLKKAREMVHAAVNNTHPRTACDVPQFLPEILILFTALSSKHPCYKQATVGAERVLEQTGALRTPTGAACRRSPGRLASPSRILSCLTQGSLWTAFEGAVLSASAGATPAALIDNNGDAPISSTATPSAATTTTRASPHPAAVTRVAALPLTPPPSTALSTGGAARASASVRRRHDHGTSATCRARSHVSTCADGKENGLEAPISPTPHRTDVGANTPQGGMEGGGGDCVHAFSVNNSPMTAKHIALRTQSIVLRKRSREEAAFFDA